MPPEEWDWMMEELNRLLAEQQEVMGRLNQCFSRSGVPDQLDLDQACILGDKLQALNKQQQDYLNRTFGRS